jgi:hypothetical protein
VPQRGGRRLLFATSSISDSKLREEVVAALRLLLSRQAHNRLAIAIGVGICGPERTTAFGASQKRLLNVWDSANAAIARHTASRPATCQTNTAQLSSI